jgi:hypothetical protein
MIVTGEGLTFTSPGKEPLIRWLERSFVRSPAKPWWPIRKDVVIAWRDVRRLWKWQPEFSGAPMIETGENSWANWTFHLLEGEYPDLRDAQLPAVREHYGCLEALWSAARA